jgi:tRNA isopentenyl-2-thiomethyl-A-37 hydroxylase MiaE
LKKIFQWLTGGVIKEVGDVIDKLTTTDEEKLLIKKQVQEIMNKANADAENQITRRWESDMKSDSWLSKNTRPLALIFLSVMAISFIWVDSHEEISFTVEQEWIALLKQLLTTVYIAYFGSRGMEKFKTISNNK